MAEHYTKLTTEASAWCNRCAKSTMHRVDNGRRGPCLDCLKKLDQVKAAPPAPQQTRMF